MEVIILIILSNQLGRDPLRRSGFRLMSNNYKSYKYINFEYKRNLNISIKCFEQK